MTAWTGICPGSSAGTATTAAASSSAPCYPTPTVSSTTRPTPRFRPRSAPGEAIRTALAQSPGRLGTYAYSNTNYVLLGQIIQAVTGRAYAVEITRRVINPLHLTGTSLPGARTTLPEPHSRAYTSNGRYVTELDPREAGASGEPISTLADLSRF